MTNDCLSPLKPQARDTILIKGRQQEFVGEFAIVSRLKDLIIFKSND
jgi:hypothetical protein